ncbi:UNVERIFIED_CONTAM: hypothetical protein GTU68_065493 [Idotea baltica]|nr:hypothetical protein [Idotea baltica]
MIHFTLALPTILKDAYQNIMTTHQRAKQLDIPEQGNLSN